MDEKKARKPAARTARKPVAKAARAAKAVGTEKAKAPGAAARKAPAKAAASRTVKPAGREAAPARAAAKGAAPRAAKAVARAPEKPASREPAKAARKAPAKAPRRKAPPRPPAVEGLDPDGYFIARVRGEEEARLAPHPMTEGEEREDPLALRTLAQVPVPPDDEGLGDLPWSYGEDVFVALPRDPRTLFFYWDHAAETLRAAFEWLDRPRAQLRISVLGAGGEWEPLRTVEFALESRGFYVHDLEPGRSYRGEIFAVSQDGRERPVGGPSNEVALPSSGPSPIVDDRFALIPWDVPLDGWMQEIRAGGAFPDELRALLARLSAGTRPAAPAWQVRTEPGRPSSPTRAWGGGHRRRRGKAGA